MSSRRESEFARLEQLLREADELAEQERRRAEEANKRAEQERRCAEDEQRNRQEAESRAQIEGKKTRPTTFEEYIRACHTLLSKPLRIQTDKSLSTQGSITSPKNKRCPTLLKPWTDFPMLQQQLFERIYEYIPRDAENFSSIQYLKELGQDLCDRPLASEKEDRRAFNLGNGIIFENHANTLSDSNEEVLQTLQKVVEYKPSHKLSVFNIRAGILRADSGSMNVPEDVINRIAIPISPNHGASQSASHTLNRNDYIIDPSMDLIPSLLALLEEENMFTPFQESKFLRAVQIRVRRRKTADPQRPTQYFQIRSYKLIHTIETRFIRTRHAKVSIRAKTVAKLLQSSQVEGGRDITPATEKVEAIFAKSQKIWQIYLEKAQSMVSLPADSLEASNLLHRIPALPTNLRDCWFVDGHSMWDAVSQEGCDLRQKTEGQLRISLGVAGPTRCEILQRQDFRHWSDDIGSGPTEHSSGNFIAILTFAWAYIFCSELLQRQGRMIQYSANSAPVVVVDGCHDKCIGSSLVVDVGDATTRELRWWSQILVRGRGWYAPPFEAKPSRSQPPWSIEYHGSLEFRVGTSALPLAGLCLELPPSSEQAAGYLSKFCHRHHLLMQSAAAFTVVLTLPLHNYMHSTVHLPKPNLAKCFPEACTPGPLPQYKSLPYYMTLSASPTVLSSALWGVFWEPGVDCNLVNAWFAPILDQFESYSSHPNNVELLAKVLALRCPKLAPLWLGMALCGPTKTIASIAPFLKTSEAPMARPNSDVAIWTGTAQSFMDIHGSGSYLRKDDMILRRDLWQLRHDYSAGGSVEWESLPFKCTPLSAWPPCGAMHLKDLEYEAISHAKSCKHHHWKYRHWVWHDRDATTDTGFVKQDVREQGSCVPDCDTGLNFLQNGSKIQIDESFVASRRATRDIFDWASSQVAKGERLSVFAHPWLEGSIRTKVESGVDEGSRGENWGGRCCDRKVLDWLQECVRPRLSRSHDQNREWSRYRRKVSMVKSWTGFKACV